MGERRVIGEGRQTRESDLIPRGVKGQRGQTGLRMGGRDAPWPRSQKGGLKRPRELGIQTTGTGITRGGLHKEGARDMPTRWTENWGTDPWGQTAIRARILYSGKH